MKKLQLFVALLIPISAFGQDNFKNALEFSYVRNHIDKSLNLNFSHRFTRHSVEAGLRYHLWSPAYGDGSGSIYVQHAYASTPAEILGLNLGYQFWLIKLGHQKIFYDPFFFWSGVFSKNRFWYEDRDFRWIIDPFLVSTFQNNFGIGASFKITNNFSLIHSVGGGIIFYRQNNLPFLRQLFSQFSQNWEFILPYYRVGIRWYF